jgi:hypothetical protein
LWTGSAEEGLVPYERGGLIFNKGCNMKDRKIGVGLFSSDTMLENKGKTENRERKKEKRRTQGK